MDAMSSRYDSDAEHMATDKLEDTCYGSQSHTSIKCRDACYNICDRIEQGQAEWKG